MKKHPEITDATRQAFVDAFCYYYRSRPIEQITVIEVAQKAGYSRATFYKYFKDVYDVEEHIANELMQAVQEKVADDLDTEELLDSFVYRFSEVIGGRADYISLLFAPNHTSILQKMRKGVVPFLLDYFGADPDDWKVRCALEFYFSGVVTLLGVWVKSNQQIPADQLGELIKGILQEGILKQVLEG
ncbi:MAG: TetR/AcrR family transcriptional regulator [Clostridia bacterium]|nr:TetR/AcrR family transcriptional regulator [Clostridia bacterium]